MRNLSLAAPVVQFSLELTYVGSVFSGQVCFEFSVNHQLVSLAMHSHTISSSMLGTRHAEILNAYVQSKWNQKKFYRMIVLHVVMLFLFT